MKTNTLLLLQFTRSNAKLFTSLCLPFSTFFFYITPKNKASNLRWKFDLLVTTLKKWTNLSIWIWRTFDEWEIGYVSLKSWGSACEAAVSHHLVSFCAAKIKRVRGGVGAWEKRLGGDWTRLLPLRSTASHLGGSEGRERVGWRS